MHKEIDFENDIEHALISSGGYEKGDPNTYDPEAALFPADVLAFVQKTQPKIWTRLTQLDATKAPAMLLDSLVKELAAKGALAILREGFKCVGKTVRLAYFAPNTGLDPASTERYDDNRLTIVRQVNTKSGTIPDVVLAVNGLPVATLELKNPMSATRWNVENAKYQYRFERDPKELLFAFKQRCLVHFAVDTELVFMTTKLEGKDTFFLPFNLGQDNGAGNPPAAGDVRTTYLWHKALTRDSLLDILARFIHLDVEEKTVVTEKGIKRHRKESMIFPRYHQLDAVRELTPTKWTRRNDKMSVLSFLTNTASSAVLSATEQSSIATSITTLQSRMSLHFDSGAIAQHFRFGSSTRGTILPRSMDEQSDIDYIVVFSDGSATPQTYLNRLKAFVEKWYGSSEIYQSSPTIVLELNHIKFDLVPATKTWLGELQIPKGAGGWMSTNPNDFNATLDAKNKEHKSLIKPTVRLFKYWNATAGFPFQSYEMEKWVTTAKTMKKA